MVGPANVLQVVINGVNNTSGAFRSISLGAAGMAAAVAGAFTAAAVRAGQFERGVAEIGTLLDGDVRPAIASMRSELMQMSVQFGQTLGSLTKARYDIVSAGFVNAAESADVLRESARLAVAGVSTVAETADLLTTAINGLGLSAGDASRVADVLFQIVRKGKTTMSELAGAMGPVFATARTAGVQLEDLGAVMATLTANGVNVAEAAVSLNAVMRAIAAPTDDAAKALDALGINLDRGLMPALADLSKVGGEGLRTLSQFIPSIEALRAAAVAASDVQTLTDNFKAMEESSGQVSRAVGMMADTLPFKIDQLKAALDNLVVTIGTEFLPIAKKIAGGLLEAAVMVRYLTGEAEDGRPRWAAFIEELRASSPVFDALAKSAEWLAARVEDVTKNLETKAFNDRVTARMKEIIAAGNAPQRQTIFGKQDDLVALRAMAEALINLEDAANPPKTTKNVVEELRDKVREAFPELARMLAQLRGDIEGLTKPSESKPGTPTVAPPPVTNLDRFNPPKPEAEELPDTKKIDDLKEQIRSLAKFTAEDFAQIAFSIGDSFGSIIGDVANGLLGLREGPIMIGQAIKGMVAGAIADIARLIARLLVAKALMAMFGGGPFGIFSSMAGGKDGMSIPTAADGFMVPGSTMGGMFPPIILPGSPGLDRTPVLATGGELLIPRQRVNAAEKMLRKAQTSPRPASGRSRGSGRVELSVQANRPFRTTEQIKLRDSVVEGLTRGERYSR